MRRNTVRFPTGLLVAALMALGGFGVGCVAPSSVECPWGVVCPAGMRCHGPTRQCLFPSQLRDCVGRPDGEQCQVPGHERPYVCVGELCLQSVCGDGVVDDRPEMGEVCDDGNIEPGDGCRADCQGHEQCGDRLVDEAVGEQCDDANLNNEDGCTTLCRFPYCGDGLITSGEECDDGSENSNVTPDSCRTNCRRPDCGDGVVDNGEAGGCWTDRTDGGVAAGQSASSMAMGDLNGDGLSDVVVANRDANTVSLFLSNGDYGVTEAGGSPYTVAARPTGVAVGDFDRDGNLDVAVVTLSGTAGIRLGDGAGGLTGSFTLAVAGELTDVVVRDIDGDENPDLLTTDRLNDSVVVWVGVGDGSITLDAAYPVGFVGFNPTALDAGDFDRDGNLDVAVANGGHHQISVLQGTGSGRLAMAPGFPLPVTLNWNTLLTDIAVADMNGDLNLDVVFLDCRYAAESYIGVLPGNGDLTFDASPLQHYTVGTATFRFALADLDRDGILDVVAPSTAQSMVHTLIGAGDGTFDASPQLWTAVTSRATAVGDINGDEWPDLLLADHRTGVVGVYLNTP